LHSTTDFAAMTSDASGHQLDRHDSVHASVIDEEPCHEPFVVAPDVCVLQRRLEQRVQHVEAGLVRGKPGAHVLHTAEGAHGDPPVGFTAPRTPPVLQLQQLARSLLHKRLDRVLVTEPVAARDGVVGVLIEGVAFGDRAGCAALGGHRVAAHRIDLRDHGHAETGIRLR
jgi:hypothetical protein